MRKVILTIKGNQKNTGSEDDSYELVTEGEYDYTPERAVISYLETAITGFENGVLTTFMVEDGTVTLSRSGGFSGDMIFCEGKKNHFVYETPYGSFTMGIDALNVNSKLDTGGGSLYLEYTIDVENAVISRNIMKINIK